MKTYMKRVLKDKLAVISDGIKINKEYLHIVK